MTLTNHGTEEAALSQPASENGDFQFFDAVLADQKIGAGESTTPVSYTHLDVYKRQGQGQPSYADVSASDLRGYKMCIRDRSEIVYVTVFISFRQLFRLIKTKNMIDPYCTVKKFRAAQQVK